MAERVRRIGGRTGRKREVRRRILRVKRSEVEGPKRSGEVGRPFEELRVLLVCEA